MRRLWRRVADFWISLKTAGAIAERECRHDGSDPMCMRCASSQAGW